MERKRPTTTEKQEKPPEAKVAEARESAVAQQRKNGSWQEIEALREKAALKASLADVWDEEFDLDDEILSELDHKAEFFTRQEEEAEEGEFDEDDEIEEFYDDEEV